MPVRAFEAPGRSWAAGWNREIEQDLKELKIELSKNGIFTTTLEELYNWGRKNSVWPLTFGPRLLRD